MADENLENPFPDTIDPPEDIQAEHEEPKQEDEVEKRLKELEEQRERDRQEWSQRESRYQDTISRLVARPQESPTPEPQELPDPPDPVEKPKEFQSWLKQRDDQLMNRIESQQRQQSQASQQEQNLRQAWDQFMSDERYQDLADYPAEVNYAVVQEQRRLARQGLTVADAVSTDPESLYERIANKTREYLSNKGIGKDAPNRTQGVSGGTRPAKPSTPQTVKPLQKVILEQQMKDGLI